MKNKSKIFKHLKTDCKQRLIYFIIFLIWLFIGIDLVQYKYDSSPFSVDMLYVIVIPSLILFLPILINRKIPWICALSFSFLYSIWSTYKIVFDNLNHFKCNYLPSMNYKTKDCIVSFFLITISFMISYIILKMKPINKEK